PSAQHPLALAGAAAGTEVKARENALNRSYYPRLYLQASEYARGTGIQPDGRTGGAASGLGPNIQNWAIGASIVFPAFDYFSIRAKRSEEHTSELQSRGHLVCRLLLEKKNINRLEPEIHP